jgi:hypothetical protein
MPDHSADALFVGLADNRPAVYPRDRQKARGAPIPLAVSVVREEEPVASVVDKESALVWLIGLALRMQSRSLKSAGRTGFAKVPVSHFLQSSDEDRG